jgi:CDP-diacylglycerol--glycerol-3-phosphate 3-phosphatidyltransferase
LHSYFQVVNEPQNSSVPTSSPVPVPHDDMTFNTTPNQLTLLRMAFVPVVIGLLFVHDPAYDVAAALSFVAASLTDYFDGYIARTRKLETVYGKLLDPLADKFLVVSSLVMLQHLGRIHPIVVMLLICRELAITGLRALASAEGVIIPASPSAKWKTATQMVAIPCLMVVPGLFGIPLFQIGMVLLYVSLAISLWSAKDYIVDFFRGAREQRRKRTQERKNARLARQAARDARLAARAARAGKSDAP